MTSRITTDILDRPISVGDYVVFYNNIYQVVEMSTWNYVRIMLLDPSKTTRPVRKYAGEMCIVDKEDVLIWKIKKGF